MKTPLIVEVLWTDCAVRVGWYETIEVKAIGGKLIKTVGYLVDQDSRDLKVASSVSVDDDDVASIHIIPHKMVKSIKRLTRRSRS